MLCTNKYMPTYSSTYILRYLIEWLLNYLQQFRNGWIKRWRHLHSFVVCQLSKPEFTFDKFTNHCQFDISSCKNHSNKSYSDFQYFVILQIKFVTIDFSLLSLNLISNIFQNFKIIHVKTTIRTYLLEPNKPQFFSNRKLEMFVNFW